VTHPLQSHSGWFWPLATLTWEVMAALHAVDPEPKGILAFEFAGDWATARQILTEWGEAGRIRAGVSLGLDYLFLVLYSTAIALACLWAAGRLPHPALGVALAWAQWVAAGFDASENAALLAILLGARQGPWPQLARRCAAVKFVLIGSGTLYALGGLIAAASFEAAALTARIRKQ